METSLIIVQETTDKRLVLHLTGRLDATNAGYLDDKLTELLREGHDTVWLDTAEVVFLSSAGIRILVKQHKAYRLVAGEMSISVYSANVQSVLDMVGMVHLFKCKEPDTTTNPTITVEGQVKKGYRFINKDLNTAATHLSLMGNPDKLKTVGYSQGDSHTMRLIAPRFALGIGAFGRDFQDCQSRYGEFMALGDCIACLPSDTTKTPDYMVRTGQLIPEINVLYGLGINDNFQQEVRFFPESESTLSVSDLVENLAELGHYQQFAVLLVAESRGLVGASLKGNPALGEQLFHFPDIRERFRFTTEPSHLKSMTVGFGIFATQPSETLAPFLRPLHPGSRWQGHLHASVFTYTPLQKESIDYKTLIDTLFNEGDIIDVMHLLHDDRDINGVGESLFKAGHCWTTALIL